MGFAREDLKSMSVSEAQTWLRAEADRRRERGDQLKRGLRGNKNVIPVLDIGRTE